MFALGLGRVKTLDPQCDLAALSLSGSPDRGHQRLDTHNVHHASEIIGQNV